MPFFPRKPLRKTATCRYSSDRREHRKNPVSKQYHPLVLCFCRTQALLQKPVSQTIDTRGLPFYDHSQRQYPQQNI